MKAFDEINHNYQNRYSEAGKWKESGGKVVGYISAAIPEEIIMAAGLFPLRLAGDIERETDLADQYMEFSFDPLVRSLYDMLLAGEFDFLDLLVIPHVNDSVFRLYYYLMENKRQGTHPNLPDLYLLDILYTKWWGIGQYNLERIKDFKKKIEMISERPINIDDLKEAISAANENRKLLQEVNQKRRHDPPLLCGADAIQIYSTSMKKADHSRILKDLLEDESIFTSKAPTRLMFSGNPLDHTHLYQLIEDLNLTIVLEDHDWGSGYAEHLVDEQADPLDAITERYHFHTITPKVYPEAADQSEVLKK
ncbi:2-hydroxyacyl-CoA dehydratase subunit D, partial [Thermodesulfobacteriota bacterium]